MIMTDRYNPIEATYYTNSRTIVIALLDNITKRVIRKGWCGYMADELMIACSCCEIPIKLGDVMPDNTRMDIS